MSMKLQKLRLLAAFAALFTLTVAVGCHGFFVSPTLTGITVGPTTTVLQGRTVQMSATGTYDDGSTKTLSSGVFWASETESVATISASGKVTAVSAGQTTITGSSGTVDGTATITVSPANLTAITVTPANQTITVGSSKSFIATGTANGQQIVITDAVDWTTVPATITGVSIDPNTGVLTTQTGATTGTIQVVATDPISNISGQTNLTINP